MDEFVVDASLFAKAQDKIIAASEAFSSISSLLSSVKANFPEEYEYKSEVIDACGDIDEAKSYVETFKAKVAEVCANLASLDEEFAKEVYSPKWYEDLWNAYKKSGSEIKKGVKSLVAGEGTGELKKALKDTGATIAVTGTSIVAGGLKLVEYVYDGSTYADGAIRYVAAKTGDAIKGTDNASKVWDETLDAVRVDIVGDVYNAFYETRFGQKINNASNLKYDSKGAKALKTGGEFAGKVALATAATVATGGTAAPMILGALYGVGKAEEKYAQSVDRENGESYDIKRANTKAVVNAITGAIEFYGYGQIGGMLAAKGTMKGAAGSLKDMISNGTKVEGKTFAKNFVKNFVAKDTLYDSAAVVADHAGNVYLGDESFSQALKSGGGEFALALGLNMLGAGMGAYVESATPVVKNVDDITNLKDVQINKKTLFRDSTQEGLAGDILNAKNQSKIRDITQENVGKTTKSSINKEKAISNSDIVNPPKDWRFDNSRVNAQANDWRFDNSRVNAQANDWRFDNSRVNAQANDWRFDNSRANANAKDVTQGNISRTEQSYKDVEYAVQQYMEKYNVSKVDALDKIKKIADTGNYNYMTSDGGARARLQNYSVEEIKEAYKRILGPAEEITVKIPTTGAESKQSAKIKDVTQGNISRVEQSLKDVEYAVDQYMKKYNVTKAEALDQINQYIKTGNYNYVTSSGGARARLQKYTLEEIESAYKNVFEKASGKSAQNILTGNKAKFKMEDYTRYLDDISLEKRSMSPIDRIDKYKQASTGIDEAIKQGNVDLSMKYRTNVRRIMTDLDVINFSAIDSAEFKYALEDLKTLFGSDLDEIGAIYESCRVLSDAINRMEPVKIVDYKGVQVEIYNDNYLASKQYKNFKNKFDSLPDFQKRNISNVKIYGERNPLDAYWKVKYKMKNFVSSATGGQGTIYAWVGDLNGGTLAHEAGHNVDNYLGTKYNTSYHWSQGAEWQNAISRDGGNLIEGYAQSSGAISEDFAEANRLYSEDKNYFKKTYPNRYAIIERIEGGLL